MIHKNTTALTRTKHAQNVHTPEVHRDPAWSQEIEEGVLDLESCVCSYTRCLYNRQWRAFLEWCADCNYQALPASPKTIKEYICWMHTCKPIRGGGIGVKAQSLNMTKAAIRWKHLTSTYLGPDGEYHPYPDPTTEITHLIKAFRQRQAEAGQGRQKQANPLSAEDVQAIILTADRPRPYPKGGMETPEQAEKRGRLDKALCTLMFSGLLRMGDAVKAEWKHVSENPDGSGVLEIPYSKADQCGEGQQAYIQREAMQLLNDYRPANIRPSDRIFPYSRRTLTARIETACLYAGIGARSGQSARIGGAIFLAEKGVTMPALKQAGRWKSGTTVSRYIERAAISKGAMAQHAPAFIIPDK